MEDVRLQLQQEWELDGLNLENVVSYCLKKDFREDQSKSLSELCPVCNVAR